MGCVWNRVWADDRVKFSLSQMILSGNFVGARGYTALPLKVWAEAYLLGCAAVAGLELVAFDGAIKTPGVSILQADTVRVLGYCDADSHMVKLSNTTGE